MPPLAPPPMVEVRLERAQYHLLVPVTLSGERHWFILDTGAGTSVLDLGLASQLKLQPGTPFNASGGGDGSIAGITLPVPASATIEATEPVGIALSVALDLSGLTAVEGRRLGGILGGDFLRRFVVEVDYLAPRLTLHDPAGFEPPPRASPVPITFSIGHPHLRARLELPDGEQLEADFVLDLGSNLALGMTKPFVDRHQLRQRLQPNRLFPASRGVGGASMAAGTRLPALLLGIHRIRRPPIMLFGEGGGVLTTGAYFEGNLGGALLSQFRVFLDYARARILLEPNQSFGTEIAFDGSGLSLELDQDGTPRVAAVVAESPGFEAGIAVGDRLIAVDGDRPTLDEVRARFRHPRRRFTVRIKRADLEFDRTFETRDLLGEARSGETVAPPARMAIGQTILRY